MKLKSVICALLISLLAIAAESQQSDTLKPLKEKEAELRESWDKLQRTQSLAEAQQGQLSEEDLEIIQIEEEQRLFGGLEIIYDLAENLSAQKEAGGETEALRVFVTDRMSEVPDVLLRSINRKYDYLKKLREEKLQASSGELGILQEQIAAAEAVVNELFETAITHLEESRSLDIESTEFQNKVTELLQFRARLLAGRLKKETADRSILRKRVSANGDDADLLLKLGAAEVSIGSSVRNLEVAARLMERLELDVTAYKAILIQSTGDISKGFEVAIIKEFLQSSWEAVQKWFSEQLPGLLTKLFIFWLTVGVFHLIGKFIRKVITKAVHSDKFRISRLLGAMIASTSYKVILICGILVALMQIGISLTPVLAGLGVAGFIVGFALQETLGNFASGIMILFYRPFDEGDFVEAAGASGLVHKMSLVSTTILTIDNQTLIIPNSKIWGDVICNRSEQETRRVDLVFGVSYSAEIPKVENVIQEVLKGCELILPEPQPVVRVHELADSSVNFVVRPWVKNADYWEAYWYLMREMKIRFDQEGIGIPFPQRDIHHYYPESDKKEPSL